jgi:hypothetical protein
MWGELMEKEAPGGRVKQKPGKGQVKLINIVRLCFLHCIFTLTLSFSGMKMKCIKFS